MSSQSLGDILGRDELEGESETRAQSLEGEDELNAGSDNSSTEDPPNKAADDGEVDKTTEAESGTDEKGVSPAPDKTTDDVTDDDTDPHPVPRKVLLEERRKRREERDKRLELERQLAELKGQVSVYSEQGKRQQNHTQPNQPQASWEDEYFKDPAGATERAIREAVNGAKESSELTTAQLRMDFSEGIMRSQNLEDFDELLGEAIDLAKKSPEFAEKIQSHPHPAKFAYEYAKTQRQIAEVGSFDDLKAKIREEVRAELEREQRAKSVEQDAARVSTSSAGARSAGTSPVARVLEDIPIGDILSGT